MKHPKQFEGRLEVLGNALNWRPSQRTALPDEYFYLDHTCKFKCCFCHEMSSFLYDAYTFYTNQSGCHHGYI